MSSRLLHETSHTGSRLNIWYILWLSQHKRAHIFNYLKTILSVVIYTIWLSSEIWITCFFLVFFLGGGCFFVFTWFYFLRAVITLSCPPASPCGTLKYCIKKLLPWFLCMSIFCSGLSFNFYICKPFNWNTWAVDCDFTMFFLGFFYLIFYMIRRYCDFTTGFFSLIRDHLTLNTTFAVCLLYFCSKYRKSFATKQTVFSDVKNSYLYVHFTFEVLLKGVLFIG